MSGPDAPTRRMAINPNGAPSATTRDELLWPFATICTSAKSEEHTSELQSLRHHSAPTRRSSDLVRTHLREGWLSTQMARHPRRQGTNYCGHLPQYAPRRRMGVGRSEERRV